MLYNGSLTNTAKPKPTIYAAMHAPTTETNGQAQLTDTNRNAQDLFNIGGAWLIRT
jgi:hypothetical protein